MTLRCVTKLNQSAKETIFEVEFALYLLGQGCVPQRCVSFVCPLHFAPPLAGGGLVQVRMRFRAPPPHVREHFVQRFHSVKLPSTLGFGTINALLLENMGIFCNCGSFRGIMAGRTTIETYE